MKKILFAILISASLAGCTTLQGIATSVGLSSASPEVTMNAEKGLTVAHLAYNAVGEALVEAANSGVLKGSDAANAKIYYDKAGDALAVADKADQAANAQGVVDAVNAATDAILQAKALLGSK